MGRSFDDYRKEKMKDPAFREEYEALEPEFQLIRALIEGREERGMTQGDLASAAGMYQSEISKIETGDANPSLSTLNRIAAALNKKLKIEFVSA